MESLQRFMNFYSRVFSICLLVFSIGLIAFIPTKAVFASVTDGTITGYAWSSQIGWVNFGTTYGASRITDTAITGYAWNENFGRILLNPTQAGINNNSSGILSGKAWLEGTGWIDFSGVTINSSGVFVGTATGDNSVNINFDCTHCNVTTDWRPIGSRGNSGGGSGGGGGGSAPPSVPYSILINNGDQYTNNKTVTLSLTVRPDAVKMAISNNPDFLNAIKEDFVPTKVWNLENPDGQKTVYVKFYTQQDVPSDPISDSIVLDTTPPDIKITSIRNSYLASEDIIIGGTTSENNILVKLLIDNEYGQFYSDQSGNWSILLGKKPLGKHHVEFTAQDQAGNISKTATADFFVSKNGEAPPPSPFTLAPPIGPIFGDLYNGIKSLIPKLFGYLDKNHRPPIAVITVPKTPPLAFQHTFHYISSITLGRFVLAPLPADVKLLAQKFPKINETFNAIGVNKITDVQKLANAKLELPNLTQTVLPPTNIVAGKFAMPKGIPVSSLTALGISKIPSEVVFAKTAGGLVDFNVALSINSKGATQQTIKTIAGQPLQLVVKADSGRAVKRVVGYIVFKSRKPTQPSSLVPLNNMAASLVFANPDIASLVAPNAKVPLEGSTLNTNESVTSSNDVPTSIEQRLVLGTFEYMDNGDGLFTATVQTPGIEGEYEIFTQIEYQDPLIAPKEVKLVTVVDPEGYIYEKNGDLETRIAGAVASLYWQNPNSKQYELWPAQDFQQENPQTTDQRGTYSFLVPNGFYYLKVDAPGYLSYDGKPFEVKEGSGVHINIQLRTKYWFLNIVDWKTLLLIIVILLLIYNFYKDRRRERNVRFMSGSSTL